MMEKSIFSITQRKHREEERAEQVQKLREVKRPTGRRPLTESSNAPAQGSDYGKKLQVLEGTIKERIAHMRKAGLRESEKSFGSLMLRLEERIDRAMDTIRKTRKNVSEEYLKNRKMDILIQDAKLPLRKLKEADVQTAPDGVSQAEADKKDKVTGEQPKPPTSDTKIPNPQAGAASKGHGDNPPPPTKDVPVKYTAPASGTNKDPKNPNPPTSDTKVPYPAGKATENTEVSAKPVLEINEYDEDNGALVFKIDGEKFVALVHPEYVEQAKSMMDSKSDPQEVIQYLRSNSEEFMRVGKDEEFSMGYPNDMGGSDFGEGKKAPKGKPVKEAQSAINSPVKPTEDGMSRVASDKTAEDDGKTVLDNDAPTFYDESKKNSKKVVKEQGEPTHPFAGGPEGDQGVMPTPQGPEGELPPEEPMPVTPEGQPQVNGNEVSASSNRVRVAATVTPPTEAGMEGVWALALKVKGSEGGSEMKIPGVRLNDINSLIKVLGFVRDELKEKGAAE